MSARRADYNTFQGLGVQNLAISGGTPFAQKAFADSLQLPYPLLSDAPDLKAAKSYDVLGPSGKHPRRSFFLVDKRGIVRGRWITGDADVFPDEQILQAARKLER